MVKFIYYGHSCFLLDDGQYKVLFDPYLTGNPVATANPEDIECEYILLSHGHQDHLGDAPAIAKRTGAMVLGVPEVLQMCQQQEGGLRVHGMNLGGSVMLPFGRVRMTMAFHSSGVPGGTACGYVVSMGGLNIYFAGGTALFSDMKLIGHKDALDYALLPIGDNFTMGLEDAALAAQWLNARHIIPVHYNTWPVIAQDAARYKELTEAMSRAEVHIVSPGGTLELA